jgi:hypothetical protein
VFSDFPFFLAQYMIVPTARVGIKIQRTARRKFAKNKKNTLQKTRNLRNDSWIKENCNWMRKTRITMLQTPASMRLAGSSFIKKWQIMLGQGKKRLITTTSKEKKTERGKSFTVMALLQNCLTYPFPSQSLKGFSRPLRVFLDAVRQAKTICETYNGHIAVHKQFWLCHF